MISSLTSAAECEWPGSPGGFERLWSADRRRTEHLAEIIGRERLRTLCALAGPEAARA
ncbi:hypothetical protein ACWGDX_29740 [Streptomyces sp. NPDC055025]